MKAQRLTLVLWRILSMAKRKPLSFDKDELTKNLKESAGKGLDAFFLRLLLLKMLKKNRGPGKKLIFKLKPNKTIKK